MKTVKLLGYRQMISLEKSRPEGEWGMTVNGYGVSFGGNDNVLELVMGP